MDPKEQKLIDACDEAHREWDEIDREWDEANRELREYRKSKAQ